MSFDAAKYLNVMQKKKSHFKNMSFNAEKYLKKKRVQKNCPGRVNK